MTSLFISYRRADSQDVVGRMYERLVSIFPAEQIFRDLDNLAPGRRFPEEIDKALRSSRVALIIIGPNWAATADPSGNRRLGDPRDFVRIEVERALSAGIVVVPVLVSGARMPEPEELPPPLRPLVSLQAIQVRPDPDFRRDVDGLIDKLRHMIDPAIFFGEIHTLRMPSTRHGNVEFPRQFMCAAFSPDGRSVLSGEMDGNLWLWDVTTGQEIRRFKGHKDRFVNGVAFTPDGRRALSAGDDGYIGLWDVASGTGIRRWQLRNFECNICSALCMAISPDGQRAVSGGYDGVIRLWDLDSGAELGSFKEARTWSLLKSLNDNPPVINSVAFAPDGRRALSGGAGGIARLWDLRIGKMLLRLVADKQLVEGVAITPDGRRALTGGQDGDLRLWNLDTGRVILDFGGNQGEIWSVALAPDGRRALSGGEDGTVRLWDVENGRQLYRFEGHSLRVRCVAFSPDGRRALSCNAMGDESTLRLWSLPK